MRGTSNTIADQLRASIRFSGERQSAVAKAAEIDSGVLSRFMRAERGISLRTAARLCRHLRLVLADAKLARRKLSPKSGRRGR